MLILAAMGVRGPVSHGWLINGKMVVVQFLHLASEGTGKRHQFRYSVMMTCMHSPRCKHCLSLFLSQYSR
jgi:hypothetical protein